MFRRLAKTILGTLGYELRRKPDERVAVGFHPAYLARLCQAQTVFDVGVGEGTYPLYEAFPSAKFILVEPLTLHRRAIENISRQYDCDVFYQAVSDAEGVRAMTVDTQDPARSSLAARTPLTRTDHALEQRDVEVTTLDKILGGYPDLKRPILLKIDTEGHELEVLRGATSLLQITDVVIAEVSIAKRFEDGYEFEDLVLFMKEHGFSIFSVLEIAHPVGELRPRFADIVFTRDESG